MVRKYNEQLLVLVNYLIKKYDNIDNYYYQALLTMKQNLMHNPLYKNMNRREYYDNEKMAISFVAYDLRKDPGKIKTEFIRHALRSQIIG